MMGKIRSWINRLFNPQARVTDGVFQAFFSFSPLPQAITTTSGVMLEVNDAFCKLHHGNRDSFIGKTPVEIGFASREEFAGLLKVFEQRRDWLNGYLIKYPVKNGEILYASIFAHPIKYQNQSAVLLAFVDVTEQRTNEKAIRESERFLHTVINSIPNRVFWKDKNSILKGCNIHAAKDLGFGSPEELVDKSDFDLHEPAAAQQYVSDDQQVINSGSEKLLFEETRRGLDGKLRWILTNKVPLRDSAGDVVGVLGTYDDITERKKAETDLKLARFSIDNATSSIVWISKQARITDCNPAFCRMLQYEREELLALTIPDIDPLYTAQRWPVHWEELRTHGALTFATRQRRKDGKELDVEVRAHFIEYDGQEYNCAFINDITERKELEERLKSSHGFQQAVLNNIPSGVFWKDKDLKYLGANSFFRTVAAISQDEDIVGKTDFDFPWREHAEKLRADDREVIDNNTAKLYFVEPLRNADGKIHYNEVSKVPLVNHLGEVIGVLGTFRDITAQLEFESALKESERLFKSVVQNASAIIYIIDKDGIFRLSEGLGLAVLGLKPGEVIGLSVFEMYKDIPEITSAIRRALTGEIVSNELTVGGITFATRYTPMYNPAGEVTGILCISFDITSRKKLELELEILNRQLEEHLSELQESELKYRQIIQSSPMGIYVYEVNAQGRLVLVDTNPAADVLTGVENAKLIGKTIEEAFPGIDQSELPKRYLEAAVHGTPWTNHDFPFDNGIIKGVFEVYAFQAGHRRVAVMFLNITERKEIEEAIKLKNEELVKTNSELDRFVYSASHDLRAPIASLMGLIDVARSETDPNRIGELLNMQERSLIKLDTFIHDIVSYSRNNRMKVESTLINFNELIRGVYEHLHFLEQFNAIDRRISVAPDVVFYSDEKRISVILNNLISNSIKYADTRKPDPFVEVTVENTRDGVRLSVIDNGEGIDPRFLPQIFDMFFRATVKSTGSGIGLYIVKEVVQKMGGKVSVESSLGVGTSIIMELPNPNRSI